MADSNTQATDATSIKPVSSLRSKFECLGPAATRSSATSTPLKSPALLPSMPISRPVCPGRASLDIPRTSGAGGTGLGIQNVVTQSVVSRVRRSSSSKQRPFSVVDLRSRSPPKVTIDSPRSPPKQLSPRLPALAGSRSPSGRPSPTIRSTPGSPTSRRSAPSSRATSPAGTPSGSALQPIHALAANGRSPIVATKGPPPVNRAGKPKIAPSNAGQHTPESDGGVIGVSTISPFSTPPSSSEGTPRESAVSPPSTKDRNEPRFPGSIPTRDGYFMPPPVHHAVRHRKEEFAPKSMARASTLPPEAQRPRAGASVADGSDDRPAGSQKRSPLPSGRTSPVRSQRIPARQADVHTRVSAAPVSQIDAGFEPTPKRIPPSALTQGFDRSVTSSAPQKAVPPAVPAPRRSMDTGRSLEVRRSFETRKEQSAPALNGVSRADDKEDVVHTGPGGMQHASEFPDSTQANRRPPRFTHRPWEIATGYDTRLCAVCGEHVCTTGYVTRVWNLRTGESLLTLTHGEGVKITSVVWKPAKDVADEGKRLWLGTSVGDILEVDIPSRAIVHNRPNAHARREIVRIFRHGSELWTLDDEGKLHVWRPGASGMPSLDGDFNVFRVPRGHTASTIIGDCLWLATGRDVRIFKPSAKSDSAFQVLQKPLNAENAGDVTTIATLSSRPDEVYFGHADGKVSIYNKQDFACLGVVSVSSYKISAMTGVGRYLWAVYNTGMAYVYDTHTTPWNVKKDWRAHDNAVASIITDQSSVWKMNRLQVVTLGTDNMVRIWDGMLEEDWLEDELRKHDQEYCSFDEVTVAVLTWNAGATKPTYLRADERDNNFFREYMSPRDAPDFFVFGFQELVDLEDKKVTAKSFFKSKKKDPSEQEPISHAYRAWRDHLVRCLDEYMPSDQTYTLLHTASLVGLFSCVFVKTSLRSRIRNVSTAEVKRGMGGMMGNKGALILRLIIDDSSICFINCHLAAGQTQTIHRNNDVAAILESENLPPCSTTGDVFVSGGDGSMIMDHEVCILNGDLNYRIDAMTRDAVVRSVRDNNLTKLLDRDQLQLSRKRNPGFRLRSFQELPITFAPTYKYNVGTDEYDTSEKRRSPAWCDRLLYRGKGRVKCLEYRRWEVRVSDHRPVSGRFRVRVKTVDPSQREKLWHKVGQDFERFRADVAHQVKLDYLKNVLGLPQKEAGRLLQA